jgi:hypothetical protein
LEFLKYFGSKFMFARVSRKARIFEVELILEVFNDDSKRE